MTLYHETKLFLHIVTLRAAEAEGPAADCHSDLRVKSEKRKLTAPQLLVSRLSLGLATSWRVSLAWLWRLSFFLRRVFLSLQLGLCQWYLRKLIYIPFSTVLHSPIS